MTSITRNTTIHGALGSLGHASVGITLDTYSHVLPTMQAEAAAAFDEIFESKHDASDS